MHAALILLAINAILSKSNSPLRVHRVRKVRTLVIRRRGHFCASVIFIFLIFLLPAYVVRGKVIFILGNVCLFTFGGGGVPGLRFLGGVPGLRFLGGGPRSQIFGGGYPVSVKGKIFDTRFGLIHVQTRKKILVKGPPPPE